MAVEWLARLGGGGDWLEGVEVSVVYFFLLEEKLGQDGVEMEG